MLPMFEIGQNKRAQRAFAFDDVSIVPSRRTRGEEEVSLSWRIDAATFEFPLLAAPMDSVMSPHTAILLGRLGGLGVLNLEGLWTRYADPEPLLETIGAVADPVEATRVLQQIYAEPIKPELIGARIAEIRAAGVPAAGALSPQNTAAFAQAVVDSGVDFFVIRGTTVSAEHVSGRDRAVEPQAVHLRPRRTRHRRRLRDLPGGAAPDAYRRRRRLGRLRRGGGRHHQLGARSSGTDGVGHLRRRGRPA